MDLKITKGPSEEEVLNAISIEGRVEGWPLEFSSDEYSFQLPKCTVECEDLGFVFTPLDGLRWTGENPLSEGQSPSVLFYQPRGQELGNLLIRTTRNCGCGSWAESFNPSHKFCNYCGSRLAGRI